MSVSDDQGVNPLEYLLSQRAHFEVTVQGKTEKLVDKLSEHLFFTDNDMTIVDWAFDGFNKLYLAVEKEGLISAYAFFILLDTQFSLEDSFLPKFKLFPFNESSIPSQYFEELTTCPSDLIHKLDKTKSKKATQWRNACVNRWNEKRERPPYSGSFLYSDSVSSENFMDGKKHDILAADKPAAIIKISIKGDLIQIRKLAQKTYNTFLPPEVTEKEISYLPALLEPKTPLKIIQHAVRKNRVFTALIQDREGLPIYKRVFVQTDNAMVSRNLIGFAEEYNKNLGVNPEDTVINPVKDRVVECYLTTAKESSNTHNFKMAK